MVTTVADAPTVADGLTATLAVGTAVALGAVDGCRVGVLVGTTTVLGDSEEIA